MYSTISQQHHQLQQQQQHPQQHHQQMYPSNPPMTQAQTHQYLSQISGSSTSHLDHLNCTPCLLDLDTNYQFEVEVPMDQKEKKLWFYDASAKRLFVKLDQSLSAFVSCNTYTGGLFVRLMPVYTSLADVRKPVNRCINHKQQCKTTRKQHIVHCHNEGAEYMGTEIGETFIDRMSIRVPLRKSMQARNCPEKITEEIMFSFSCLNSCTSGINRRPTALIFTLENEQWDYSTHQSYRVRI